jgi:SAM-dependent methyltransferase
MAQITHGLRSILSHSIIYTSFQTLMGAHKARQNFIKNFVKPVPGMKILDIGCGPADILDYFPEVDYWGFDISENYINQARKKYGARGKFQCQQLQMKDIDELPSFDLVLALGLLHHLDDDDSMSVIKLASKALKADGKLLTIDPCFDSSQNPVARFLICNDRGQNVRDKAGYEKLARAVFEKLVIEVRHQLWIPYTHCFMECQK